MTNEEIMTNNYTTFLVRTIEHKINETIEFAANDYKTCGPSQYNDGLRLRIHGMIDVLKTITGKEYYFDENGLHERKTA